jgi:hypothetical protein
MKWTKKGLIFKAEGQHEWMTSHTSVPVADKISNDVVRIYFGPRDSQGRTHTAFIEVAAGDPGRVLYVPSAIVTHGGKKFFYYIGWNTGVTVPYRNAIGVAVSEDGGVTFNRVFEGPVMDRTPSEPLFPATPYVLIEDGLWRCWYSSTTEYVVVDDRAEPVYQIKYAESDDGLNWRRPNITCIPYKSELEANSRPSVIKEANRYRMWYCYRGSVGYRTDKDQSYRMGYAESADGLKWQRLDEQVGIERSEEGWDSEMIAYPNVYEHDGSKYMLYCGNGFGRSGFGYAILE